MSVKLDFLVEFKPSSPSFFIACTLGHEMFLKTPHVVYGRKTCSFKTVNDDRIFLHVISIYVEKQMPSQKIKH